MTALLDPASDNLKRHFAQTKFREIDGHSHTRQVIMWRGNRLEDMPAEHIEYMMARLDETQREEASAYLKLHE